jgi:hypothetical protein
MELKKLGETKHIGIKRKAVDEGGRALLDSSKSSTQNQTLLQCINRRTTAWSTSSDEHKSRLNSLIHMIITTCNPVTLVDNAAFRKFVNTLEPKFAMPAFAKLNSLLDKELTVLKSKLRDLISKCRRFTICLDGWTKKGLATPFLGISVCFFTANLKSQYMLCLICIL